MESVVKKSKFTAKRLSAIVLLITIIIISWVIFEVIVRGFSVVQQQYGIDPAMFLKIIIGAEIFFDLGVVLIILGSGALKLRFRHIFNLDFQNITFDNKLVYTGFTINRIAAFIPPVYLVFAGWGKLPILVFILLLIEIVFTLFITIVPFEGIKIFKAIK